MFIASVVSTCCYIRKRLAKGNQDSTPWKWMAVGTWTCMFLVIFFNLFTLVSTGKVAVSTLMNEVQKSFKGEGFNIVNPFYDFHEMTVQRQAIEFQSSSNPKEKEHDPIQAMSRDNLIVDVEANCPFILNPIWAWWVYQNIGDDKIYVKGFVKPAARSALRDAIAKVTFLEAGTENREKLEIEMTKAFQLVLKNDLMKIGKGLNEEQAGEVFVILPVQLRKVLPPEKVQNSINEKVATDQDLQRQKTLTDIAEQIALRRTNEGQGISNLFAKLPKDITPKDMAGLLGAIAKKENADALMKAVETGQLKTVIFSNGPPVAIPAQ